MASIQTGNEHLKRIAWNIQQTFAAGTLFFANPMPNQNQTSRSAPVAILVEAFSDFGAGDFGALPRLLFTQEMANRLIELSHHNIRQLFLLKQAQPLFAIKSRISPWKRGQPIAWFVFQVDSLSRGRVIKSHASLDKASHRSENHQAPSTEMRENEPCYMG